MVSLFMVHQPQYTKRNMQVICDFLFLGSSYTGFSFFFVNITLMLCMNFKGLRANVLLWTRIARWAKLLQLH